MKGEILALAAAGVSHSQIAKQLGCSKGLVSYHLSPGQKEKTKVRKQAHRKKNPLAKKVENFQRPYEESTMRPVQNIEKAQYMKVANFERREGSRCSGKVKGKFSFTEFVKKVGPEPQCYLTGRSVDLEDTASYSIDHIEPQGKGGSNELCNAGLLCAVANRFKTDLTVSELFDLMVEILLHHGWSVHAPTATSYGS